MTGNSAAATAASFAGTPHPQEPAGQAPGCSRRAILAGAVATGVSLAAPAMAQTFPSRPLVIMAPANPGGGWDQLARLMQLVIGEAELSPRPVEVVNKGGAGGAIGLADLVSRHHGDPYMIMAAGSVMIGATISQNSPFRMTDTEPLARLVTEHLIVAVPVTSPHKTMADFIAAFRADPASVSWCGGSAGGVDHILVGLIAEAAGVAAEAVRYVAFSGGGAASAAIMGGQVSAGVAGYSEWKGLAEAGNIRILASATAEPIVGAAFPNLRQSGLNVVLENWRGVFAAPGIEPEHRAWWMTLLERMRATPMWQNFLQANGWQDGFLPGDAFKQFIAAEEAQNTQTLTRLGMVGGHGGHAPVGPWAFPTIIGVAGAAAVAAVTMETLKAPAGQAVVPAGSDDDDEGGGPLPIWRRFFAGVGIILAYIVSLSFAGFLISTPIFIMALCVLMRSKKLIWDAVAAVLMTAAVWLLFSRVLSVQLP
jgi:putative tricarboxylic transport membrane protein